LVAAFLAGPLPSPLDDSPPLAGLDSDFFASPDGEDGSVFVLSVFDSPDELLSSDFESLDEAFFDPYPSAYQPPPFKMKPAPLLICRFAVFFPHFGHFRMGSSTIRCSSSQALWHEEQI